MGTPGFYPTIRFLQRHRTAARLLNRGPVRRWIARRVWDELEHDPAFVEGMARGRADIEAGRVVRWEDVRK